MKTSITTVLHSLLYILAATLCVSCNNKDDDDPGEQDLYSWSDLVGVYATKPEKVELTGYDWATYYQAYALEIEEYVLTDCGAIDNSDYVDGYIDTYCTGLVGDWYSDMFAWDIYGLRINGASVDIYTSSGEPTGRSIEVHDDYIVYNGRTYYTASYFNQHVNEWTKDSGSGSTPPQNENISVSISCRTTSSSRFLTEYDITVTATGSNFTVQQIGLETVSGIFYQSPYNTSAHSHTFSVSYTYGSSSKVRGYVKTASGTYYSSNTITLSK